MTGLVALLLAVVVAGLSMWIVVPAPTRTLLPLAVGAPEVSAWLFVGAVIAAALALPAVRSRRTARWAMALALPSALVTAWPLLRASNVARDVEQQLARAFGPSALDALTGNGDAPRAVVRTSPLVTADLFRGMPTPTVRVAVTPSVRYSVRDGHALSMTVYRPADSATYPVLVQIYGGAWQRGSPSDDSTFASHFAARGYVVFAIDYRHAPAVRFPTPVEDVRDALAWISAHAATYNADASRVVLLGRSAGAHLAMMAAYAPGESGAPRVRGVVSFYGPVDLTEGYRSPPSPDPLRVRDVEETFLGGTPSTMPDRYRAASPITLVTRQLPPTLLLYGGRDHIVEPRFGRQLAAQLRKTGTSVVHVELPWAEHAFDAVPNGPGSQIAYYAVERFLAVVMAR